MRKFIKTIIPYEVLALFIGTVIWVIGKFTHHPLPIIFIPIVVFIMLGICIIAYAIMSIEEWIDSYD